MVTKIEVFEWLEKTYPWNTYVNSLINGNNWTTLSYGSTTGTKQLLGSRFQNLEEFVAFCCNIMEEERKANLCNIEMVGKWIVYNLLQLRIANEFILAAKDVKLFGINDEFNINVLGPKYQTGWVINNKKHLEVSFVFWGKGDGSKNGKNQRRLKCKIQFLDMGEFFCSNAKSVADFAKLRIIALFEFQSNSDKSWRRTVYTTWNNILNDARTLNGIQP